MVKFEKGFLQKNIFNFLSMILVTGGTGLVGTHLLYELLSGGRDVRALMRGGSNVDLVRRIFLWYDPARGQQYFDNINWAYGDLNDLFSLRDVLKDVKQVYHCGAMVSFLPQDRELMMKVNVEGTANLVNACLEAGIDKMCHCSSVAAIGKPEKGSVIEESLVWKTSKQNSWYAISKYGAEREVWRGSEEGIPTVIVNPSVVIGPGDPGRSSAQLYQSVKNGMKFYTTGITGFVDARDVATAMVQLMESDITGERFVLNSENLPYKTLFEYFAEYSGARPPKYRAGKFLSEIAWRLEKMRSMITGQKPLLSRETARNANLRRYYSSEKIQQQLGFEFRPIREAAKNTSEFFQRYPIHLSPDLRIGEP